MDAGEPYSSAMAGPAANCDLFAEGLQRVLLRQPPPCQSQKAEAQEEGEDHQPE